MGNKFENIILGGQDQITASIFNTSGWHTHKKNW